MSEAFALKDKVVVITGTLMIGTRKEIEQFIADSGGETRSSVSAKTQLLIYGEKAGSKLQKAQELGVETISEEAFYKRYGLMAPDPLDLKDKVVVITGTLVLGTRKDIEQFIADSGGETRSSVSAKTQLLIYGEKAGSKLQKAQELGIEVMSEAEFYQRAGFA